MSYESLLYYFYGAFLEYKSQTTLDVNRSLDFQPKITFNAVNRRKKSILGCNNVRVNDKSINFWVTS